MSAHTHLFISRLRRKKLFQSPGYDLRQIAHFAFRSASDGLLAERAGRHDHIGPRSLQLSGHGPCNLHLLTVRNRRIGHRGSAAKGILARRRRFEQLAHRFDHGPGFVVNPASAPQFTGIVVREARRAVLGLQAPDADQPQDILRMVEHLNARQVVILAEDFQTDRARSHERRNAVFAEEIGVVFHHLARGIGLPGELERTPAADPALAVGPPDLLARRLEDCRHGRQRPGREQRHAAREVAHLALTRRAVQPRKIAVTAFVGDVVHLVSGVEAQRVEVDVYGAFLDAAPAHQTVVGHLKPQMAVAAVAQEIDRLHVVDFQDALQLTGVDADAAARTRLDLEMVVRRLLLAGADPVSPQEDQRDLREDVHVAREGQRHEENPETRGVEPPGGGFERHERHDTDVRVHPSAEASGEESPAAVEGAGSTFGQQPRREDEPQGREGDAVAEDVLRRAAHPHGTRVEPLAPGQRHARKDEEQQQVHQEVEHGFVFEARGEVFEEDVALDRHPAEAEIGNRLDPSGDDQQEPPEGERHVHVAQQGVDTEDPAVQERFAHDLADRRKGTPRGQSAQDPQFVLARQEPEPSPPLPRHDQEHQRGAEDERQTERSVESHRQKSPSLRLISITTPRVLIPRGQTRRHLPHNMHLFISS